MVKNIDIQFQSHFIELDEVNIHLVHNGQQHNGQQNGVGTLNAKSRPVILLLHGFPEYHGAWEQVQALLANDYLLIAPDQRGFNLSSAPQDLSSYATRLLVSDMIEVMDKILPGQDYHLVGHDWGASIAYAMAIKQPKRIITLNIINGVHPITFQRALCNDKSQAKASQYFFKLSAVGAAEKMSENNFARTFSMFEKFSSSPWLNDKQRQNYINAWSRPGRMNGMLNWYRASPMIVPTLRNLEDEPMSVHAPLLDADGSKFNITMPHLVLWGMQDTALLPVARAGLEQFAEDLKIVEVEDAGHWINHTHPHIIADEIRHFIASR